MQHRNESCELKASAYNIIVPAEEAGRAIAYNTRTGALALVSEGAATLLRDAALDAADESALAEGTESSSADPMLDAANGLASGPALAEDTLARMIEAGFLVEADRDELAEVEAAHQALQQDSTTFALCIAPTYSCNLACPYCYEATSEAPGKTIDRATQDRIIAFAKTAFEAAPYERLEIQWYGGEPLLVPDAIEHISTEFIRFCDERGLTFYADMVSNASRIGAEEAALLARSRVSAVMTTVDGPEEVHNQRRPLKSGGNSFEAVLGGIGHLLDEGISVTVQMNTDRVNDPLLDKLNEQLQARFGLTAARVKLNDYYHTFGTGRFCEPTFSLMDHREFTREGCRLFCDEGHDPREFAALMQPIPLFCRGQRERYYAVDAMGDVYKCDGHMGRAGHELFNLSDITGPADIPANTAPAYPFDDPACRTCNLLPVCKGTCEWERTCCEDHPCHPLKYTTEGYLRGWVHALGAPMPTDEDFAVLASA